MRRIQLADAAFLLNERRETPMHVGGISLFTLPEGVEEGPFLAELGDVLRNAAEYRKPFGEYVVTKPTGMFWELDKNIDVDYHVRHSALPKPGRYRELFALASRLHSVTLDRHRPLWEMHLIEGLQNRQFAMYNKMHHAAIDGIGAMHITQGMLSTNKKSRGTDSPLSLAAYDAYKATKYGNNLHRDPPKEAELRAVSEVLKQTYDSGSNLMGALRRFSGAFFGRSGNLAVPWHNVPKTSINTAVSGSRRFVAQSWEFERIKAVCKAMDGTVNDVVLAMCSGALRRYLDAMGELPRHSLKAMAPVSLRAEGDMESSNAIGFITADLATNHKNPEQRLRAIQRSMKAGKEMLQGLSAREAAVFMQLTQLPAMITSVLGLAAKYPAFSTVISNVPGPKEQLYWNGASLDGIYPASIVFDGFAMNITLVSYNKSLDFGVVACRRSLPQIQRFIDHLEESLQELEEAAGLRAVKATKVARAKPKKAPTPKTKTATKKAIKPAKKTKAAVKARAKPKAKPVPKAKPTPKAKAKPKPKPKVKSKVKPKAKAKSKPKPKATAIPKATTPRPKVKRKVNAKIRPKNAS
ncbi:MAG: wax ester/triacylglycerol synthase family O-acyltransferase [Halioglobus sp.]